MAGLGPPSARVPAPLTPLVGRDGRVDRAWQALQSTRFLTLTGPGGSGKTRLAIEIASRAEAAAWVELAPLTEARYLAEYIATALGVPDRTGKPSLAHIVDRFGTRALLLVVDNCEHVVEPCASFIARLLRECPAMKVMATSREALGVPGERTLLVPPLSLPADESLEEARRSDAVALFVDRAGDVRAGFELTADNAGPVARICRRVDGIPLAIELAAARLRALDPATLAERLESSFALLETASRSALPRHRTIRDTIDWSYRLLSEQERRLFGRLSVFNGSFSLDAVEAVCGAPGDPSATLDLLTALLDKSLLLCDMGDAGTRYRMLETVREYAAERLQETGETDAVRERHARFFVSLAERAAPEIFGGAGDETWLARLDEETANLREAHDWCEQQTNRLDLSLRLAVALQWYWYARGRFNEGRLRTGIALTFAENVDPVLRGRALTVIGRLAIWQGDYASVHAPMEEAVSLLQHADAPSRAYALHGLAVAAALQGRLAEARRLIEEAAALVESDPPIVFSAWLGYWRGLLAEWDREPALARKAYEQALAIGRRLAHKAAIAHALCVLGRLAAAEGRLDVAASALHESLCTFGDTGDRWGMVYTLQGLARAAAAAGDGARAATLLGAADLVRDELGIEVSPPFRAYHEAAMSDALARVGEPAFWRAWAEGRKRPLSETLSVALAPAAGDAAPADSAEAPADIRIRTLGAFETHVRNRRVEKTEWGSSRARELLAFLASHPEGCTKAEIGLALWPDASPGQLRNTFHVTLHRLRHALGLPEAILADGDRYRLNPSLVCELDAERFERDARAALLAARGDDDPAPALAAALARYRGEFLPEAGEWADERRERLRQLHLDTLDALGRVHTDRGRHAEAADAFRAILAADPTNEDACGRLMRALASLGDRGGALRAYESLARALREDLGVKPSRETLALRDRLFAGPALS